jgi:hypothetical protein
MHICLDIFIFCFVKYSSKHMHVLKIIICQELYAYKILGCSAHVDLALLKQTALKQHST